MDEGDGFYVRPGLIIKILIIIENVKDPGSAPPDKITSQTPAYETVSYRLSRRSYDDIKKMDGLDLRIGKLQSEGMLALMTEKFRIKSKGMSTFIWFSETERVFFKPAAAYSQ